MKRRGFLGFMGGAVVAGPSMAKQAAANALSDLSIGHTLTPGGLGGLVDAGYATAQSSLGVREMDYLSYGRASLEKIMGITAAQRARIKQGQHVGQLDPDIASYRSIALHAKIDWQRERQVNALLTERKSWWQRMVDGNGEMPRDPDHIELW